MKKTFTILLSLLITLFSLSQTTPGNSEKRTFEIDWEDGSTSKLIAFSSGKDSSIFPSANSYFSLQFDSLIEFNGTLINGKVYANPLLYKDTCHNDTTIFFNNSNEIYLGYKDNGDVNCNSLNFFRNDQIFFRNAKNHNLKGKLTFSTYELISCEQFIKEYNFCFKTNSIIVLSYISYSINSTVKTIDSKLVTSTNDALELTYISGAYPNPISKNEKLNFGKTVVNYMIKSLTGNIMQTGKNTNETDVLNFPKGIYILDLDGKIEKVIVE